MFKSKWIFVAVLLCVLLPFAANATITRVIGLGGVNTNYIIKDASNPQIWPQLIADWPNLAGAEFYTPPAGGWDFHNAYLNYSFGASGDVVQFNLDNLPGVRSMFYGNPNYTIGTTVPDITGAGDTPASKLSIRWGRPWNGMKIGAALNIAEHSYKTNATPAVEQKATLLGIDLGASLLDNKLDASVGFETVSGSVKPGTGGSEDKTDGSMALDVSARYWWMYAEKLALVPNLRFLTMKDAGKLASGDKHGITTTDIKIGAGHNWTPVENALAIFEFGVDFRNVEDKVEPNGGTATTVKTTMNALPYWRIGFETKVFSWLNTRIGAERNWLSEKIDNGAAPAVSPETGLSQTNFYLGATAYWNRLVLDLLVDPAFMQNGPNFISGNAGPMFARVSLKYDFNK